MRRLAIVLAVVATMLLGSFGSTPLQASASMPTQVDRGSVTLTVGPDSFGLPTWTATFAGTFTAGGHTYTGSATGTGTGGHNFVDISSLTGSSSTGTLSGYCSGVFVEDIPSTFVGGPPPAVVPDHNFTGVIDLICSVSINGRPYSPIQLVVGLLPTTDSHVFRGLYVETTSATDITRLPTIPLISVGTSSALTDGGSGVDPSISFGYTGQITFGGRTFHGMAAGGVAVAPAPSVSIPPFALTAQNSTDTLSATCAGQWRSASTGVGPALSVLACNGSVNAGPTGTVTLVSVYAETSSSASPGESSAAYDGVFAGI